MAAGLLINPGWTPAVDSDGAPIPDARAYYYVDETTTLASIYADEGLSTPLPNPLEANSSGRWPIVWADDADTYTVTTVAPYGPAGVPFTVTGLRASQATDILVMESVTAAADQADAAAAAAEQSYQDILALAGSLPSTDPIVIAGKADVDGGNIISAPDQLAFRQAIGATSSVALAAGTGGSLVGTLQTGTGTYSRTLTEVLSDTISLMSYIPSNLRAAIRDRTSTANVTTYVQAAVNDAVSLGRALYVPCGKYNVQDVSLPDNLVMIGEDRDTCSFVAVANTSDVFVNTNQMGTVNVRLERMTIQGGRYGVSLTQSSVAYVPSNWVFRDVKFLNSTDADVRSNYNMILFVFERVIFNGVGNNGVRAFSNVVVVDGTANINSFLWCEFKELPGRAISFQVASEATTIVGCRFEARRPNFFAGYETVFYLSGARAFLVNGSYFEGAHRVILTEVNSNDGVTFANNRFSGQETSNAQQEIFNSNGVITFDANDFNIGSYGAKQAFIRGKSKGLDDSLSWVWGEGKTTLRTPLIAGLVNTTKKPLFTATKPAGAASVNNHAILNVGMVLSFVGNDTGGNPAKVRYVRPFCLSGFANGNIAIAYGFEDNGPASAAVVNPQFGLTGAASATAFEFGAGITITNFDQASMVAQFEFQTVPLPGIAPFTVAPVLASGPVGPWT